MQVLRNQVDSLRPRAHVNKSLGICLVSESCAMILLSTSPTRPSVKVCRIHETEERGRVLKKQDELKSRGLNMYDGSTSSMSSSSIKYVKISRQCIFAIKEITQNMFTNNFVL